jgi:hypothetical protein
MEGYNSEEAIPCWQRRAKLSGSGTNPAFLSDHISNEDRINRLQELMPGALKIF